jgi:copper chaperone
MPDFTVPDMTCQGCVRALTGALQDVDAAAVVQADVETKKVHVDSSASIDALAAAIRDAGFTVAA